MKARRENPFSLAASVGLGGALCTTIGAAIRHNSIHDEALTFLAGGSITGAIAGTISYMLLPKINGDSSNALKLAANVLNTSLSIAAVLTAPLMGKKCLDLDTQWDTTVVDELIGSATIIGGAVALGGVATCVGVGLFSQSLFNRKSPQTQEPAPLQGIVLGR